MKANIEDERKFLVKSLPKKYLETRSTEITQWYIWLRPPVRVRVEDFDDCYLAMKIKKGPGVNREFTRAISLRLAHWLARFRKFHKIRKTRYNIENWELDIFKVNLWGLVLLEFEKKPGSEILVIPPDIIAKEVTGEEMFSNHNLVKLFWTPEEWRCSIV